MKRIPPGFLSPLRGHRQRLDPLGHHLLHRPGQLVVTRTYAGQASVSLPMAKNPPVLCSLGALAKHLKQVCHILPYAMPGQKSLASTLTPIFCIPLRSVQHEGYASLTVPHAVVIHELLRCNLSAPCLLRMCLSPSIFALLISPIARKLTAISPQVQGLLYANGLLIIVTRNPYQAVFTFDLAWADIKSFSGLFVNAKKCAILLKGVWTESHKVQLLSTGPPIQKFNKYLGVQFGAASSEEAYSHALHKAMGRAFAVQTWALSLPERIITYLSSPSYPFWCTRHEWCITVQL